MGTHTLIMGIEVCVPGKEVPLLKQEGWREAPLAIKNNRSRLPLLFQEGIPSPRNKVCVPKTPTLCASAVVCVPKVGLIC